MKCISPVYVRRMGMHVPCGKCGFCVEKAIKAWCLRLGHEMEVSSSAFFITLTYNDEHLPPNAELSKRDLQLFIKRLRKANPGIRYFAIGEYGTEEGRPHYHAIIFNLVDLDLVNRSWTDNSGHPIGFIVGERCGMGAIRYVVAYMALPQVDNGKAKAFRIMSRGNGRPGDPNQYGIGYSYVKRMKNFHKARSDAVVYSFSSPNSMPRYYKEKIFSKGQLLYINMKARQYSEDNAKPVCPIEHDRLIKKLNRKHR